MNTRENFTLEVPADLATPTLCKLHPYLLAAREAIEALAAAEENLEHVGGLSSSTTIGTLRREGATDADVGVLYDASKALRNFLKRPDGAPEGVYTVPLLAPEFCDSLVRATAGAHFAVNEDEPVPAQIPELVLQESAPDLYACIEALYKDALYPLLGLIFGQTPGTITSIQMARYTPSTVDRGAWHFDADSDQTVVVALNDDHAGGGTIMRGLGLMSPQVVVPQLPKGHALIFPGRIYRHKGLPVTEGCRNLLVFWSMLTDETCEDCED